MGAGFSADVDQQLYEDARVSSLEEWQTFVVLLMDEMHIRDELVYDKHTGSLVGFTDLGDINSHFDRLEQTVRKGNISDKTSPLATSIMVMMVSLT